MTSITLHINTSNDAFQPDPHPELARIFHTLANRLDDGADLPILIKDSNGNLVGGIKEDPTS